MTGTDAQTPALTSITGFVYDLVCGNVQRHTFTQWELELLLDLQTCRVHPGMRADMLRRYIRAVQQHYCTGASYPLRLATFLERENAGGPQLSPAA
jgi:hypothetical protein